MTIFGIPVEIIIFFAISIVTLGAGLAVVIGRNLFRAALAMMISFGGVAGIYITLDAGFLAAAQLLVYVGAISILIIFAVMLTRRMMQATEAPFNSQMGLGLFTAVVAAALIIGVIGQFWWGDQTSASRPEVPDAILGGSVQALGEAFVQPGIYVVPFIIASMLLLAALIGSIYVAWPAQSEAES
jgi:NADH:ubiquinone oxidoreductase subunit 6 (subunit J)